MILTKEAILREIKNKRIKIYPFNRKNIGPASIDLTLDSRFHVFKQSYAVTLSENTSAESLCNKKTLKSVTLNPGDFVLGRTREKITLPDDICGFLSGRSKFARVGLTIDVTAFFIQPGVSNRQVFEIKNLSGHKIILKPGSRIAQLILERTEGKAKYFGKFRNQ
jgi:dCTP deaminase